MPSEKAFALGYSSLVRDLVERRSGRAEQLCDERLAVPRSRPGRAAISGAAQRSRRRLLGEGRARAALARYEEASRSAPRSTTRSSSRTRVLPRHARRSSSGPARARQELDERSRSARELGEARTRPRRSFMLALSSNSSESDPASAERARFGEPRPLHGPRRRPPPRRCLVVLGGSRRPTRVTWRAGPTLGAAAGPPSRMPRTIRGPVLDVVSCPRDSRRRSGQ